MKALPLSGQRKLPLTNSQRATLNCNRATGTAAYKSGKVKPLGPSEVQAERTRNTTAVRLRGTETSPHWKHATPSSKLVLADAPMPCGYALMAEGIGGTYYVQGYLADSAEAFGYALKHNLIATPLNRKGEVA